MTRRTEKFEQEYIDAWIEEERQPNHQYVLPDKEGEALEPGQLAKPVLENTDEYNRGFLPFDSEGNYLT